MRIALLYDPWLLSARGTLDLDGYRDDSRGMTGSEQCAVRLWEELRGTLSIKAGSWDNFCTLYTRTSAEYLSFDTKNSVEQWEKRGEQEWDVAISINCPDPLKDVRAKFKVCYALLNDFTFCKVGFEQHVDLFVSPSAPHLEQVMTNPAWRRVEMTPDAPDGKGRYEPDPSKWEVVPLGCDPERYVCHVCGTRPDYNCDHDHVRAKKVPGRVVYCSSPDRGLHWLLQEWAAIKRAVPHAHLKIFYRLEKWIADLKSAENPQTGEVFHSVKALHARAIYIEEALRRLRGYDVEVCDSVSRAQIEREMAEAEVLAYPCDTTTWSEGFSCTVLEACAARACPVITGCDALAGIYGEVLPVHTEPWISNWRDDVIRALTDEAWRKEINDGAEALARSMTWKLTAERLMAAIQAHSSK